MSRGVSRTPLLDHDLHIEIKCIIIVSLEANQTLAFWMLIVCCICWRKKGNIRVFPREQPERGDDHLYLAEHGHPVS